MFTQIFLGTIKFHSFNQQTSVASVSLAWVYLYLILFTTHEGLILSSLDRRDVYCESLLLLQLLLLIVAVIVCVIVLNNIRLRNVLIQKILQ